MLVKLKRYLIRVYVKTKVSNLDQAEILLQKYESGDYSFTDIYYYLQGKARMKKYYDPNSTLPKHIESQISFRLVIVNPTCKEQGYCIECGCTVPDVLGADKACERGCYPKMVSKRVWSKYDNIYDEDLMEIILSKNSKITDNDSKGFFCS